MVHKTIQFFSCLKGEENYLVHISLFPLGLLSAWFLAETLVTERKKNYYKSEMAEVFMKIILTCIFENRLKSWQSEQHGNNRLICQHLLRRRFLQRCNITWWLTQSTTVVIEIKPQVEITRWTIHAFVFIYFYFWIFLCDHCCH